jgi:hypothetical protein
MFSWLRKVMARRAAARAQAAMQASAAAQQAQALAQLVAQLEAARTVKAVGRARRHLPLLVGPAQRLMVLAVLGRRQELRAQARATKPRIPDKFIVKGADGQIDHAATALKLSGSYAGLEKRFGSGDVRPDTVEGYKVNVPEALKDKVSVETLAGNDAFKAFLGSMHAAGASQKVLDVAVSEFLTGGGLAPDPAMLTATCVSTLKGVDGWKDQAGIRQAHRAFAFSAAKSFADKAGVSMDEIAKSGLDNNPTFIRIMAAIGPEIAEDRGASPEAAPARSRPASR